MQNANVILARSRQPGAEATVYFERHLRHADAVAEVFALSQSGAARFTQHGWKYLWDSFGLSGLIAIGRRRGLFEDVSNAEVVIELIQQSQEAGYDPVSGFFGTYIPQTHSFELSAT